MSKIENLHDLRQSLFNPDRDPNSLMGTGSYNPFNEPDLVYSPEDIKTMLMKSRSLEITLKRASDAAKAAEANGSEPMEAFLNDIARGSK